MHSTSAGANETRKLADMSQDQLREELERTREQEANLHGALNMARAEKARLKGALRQQSAKRPEEPKRIAIEVRDLDKSFQLPVHQAETLKERILHPRRFQKVENLRALDSVSFEVGAGEFLGIAGPNGSGKSSLLKILAGIYTADEGTVRIAGRVAPFIELGIGLNPELAAHDNVVISGVMMGLEPDAARSRFDEVIAFAGLEQFTEMKLKNYSSGMQARLAFSVMAQVDADVLLIDEVLAVGDAEFREKCLARLHELRSRGTTILFVTHEMGSLANDCDRAILLQHGRIVLEGDPSEVADRYELDLLDPGLNP